MSEHLGPYHLLSRLGSGGFGEVHLALDPEGRTVAVKVLHPHVAADAVALARLAREVETMRRVGGPYVAEVLDASLDGRSGDGARPYLVTRYVQGRPLSAVTVPVADLPRLAAGLAAALLAMHEAGVIHRDLKPANVMMAEGRAVVIDFGIASALDSLSVTASGAVVGTPGYLAPEVLEGREAGMAADVFSFGATLAYAATGRQPYGQGPASAVAYRVVHHEPDLEGAPEWLEPLLRRCLSTDPAARPTAAELHAKLGALAGPPPSEPAGTPGSSMSPAPGTPWPSAVPGSPDRPPPHAPAANGGTAPGTGPNGVSSRGAWPDGASSRGAGPDGASSRGAGPGRVEAGGGGAGGPAADVPPLGGTPPGGAAARPPDVTAAQASSTGSPDAAAPPAQGPWTGRAGAPGNPSPASWTGSPGTDATAAQGSWTGLPGVDPSRLDMPDISGGREPDLRHDLRRDRRRSRAERRHEGLHDLETREWRPGDDRRRRSPEEARERHREKVRRRWVIGSALFVALLAAAAREPLPEVTLFLLAGYTLGVVADAGVALLAHRPYRTSRIVVDFASIVGAVGLSLGLSMAFSTFTLALFAGTALVTGIVFLLSA
ncbi:serine/threonine-protein kinase [Nonomuraea rhodomycinica]|uniref:serine/threonine-protein kinase n=1 Tax=Nonomuraea rhodomycinica TaxID=1712872 RepID=UPI001C376061|nr:serine/threonine-protein kinase [Nonomuraea rhodomycinica]